MNQAVLGCRFLYVIALRLHCIITGPCVTRWPDTFYKVCLPVPLCQCLRSLLHMPQMQLVPNTANAECP